MLKGKDCQPRIAYLAKNASGMKGGFPGGSVAKSLPANAGDAGSVAPAGDRTGRRAAEPAAAVLEPVLRSRPRPRSARALEPVRAEPLQGEARARSCSTAPAHRDWRRAPAAAKARHSQAWGKSTRASAGEEEGKRSSRQKKGAEGLNWLPVARALRSAAKRPALIPGRGTGTSLPHSTPEREGRGNKDVHRLRKRKELVTSRASPKESLEEVPQRRHHKA